MAVNIRFDYYNLTISKQRKRKSEQGQQFFGQIELSELCQWMIDYRQSKANDFGEHGKEIVCFGQNRKKWVKWIDASFDDDKLKLLCSFNDKEIDPRTLSDSKDNILSQPIPNEDYGQRTLLHIVISPMHGKICVQNIVGLTKEYTQKIIDKLVQLVAPEDIWKANDPVSQKDVSCKPCVEIGIAITESALESVNEGGLRGLVISESKIINSKFDRENHLVKQKTDIVIRADGNSFINKTKKALFGWANKVKKEKSTFDNPTLSLLIKDPQTGSEVKHEIINGVIDGFAQKCFLSWQDRTKDTHKNLASKTPTPIVQFYATMIENF